jgi:hypothetical protein
VIRRLGLFGLLMAAAALAVVVFFALAVAS